jgi:5-methylcytosine-specific restriction endonuclease McrA
LSKILKTGYQLICEETGDWWKDERRKWCAYCGIPMKLHCAVGTTIPPQKSTRDHIIPKKYESANLTIPSCRACNQAKGAKSLPEFMASDYFKKKRKFKHRNKWSKKQLWTAVGLAALERSLKA